VALLTIYDMCKAVDKDMVIRDVRLIEKTKHPVESDPSAGRAAPLSGRPERDR
jgi:hypothetical protein